MKVSTVSEMVNRGDDYVAYCNIPGMGALDIIQNLKVQWLHNGQPITEYCEFCKPELTTKYSCRILSTQSKNFSLELTISGTLKFLHINKPLLSNWKPKNIR